MFGWGGNNWLSALGHIFRQDRPAEQYAFVDRIQSYYVWDGYVNNTIYETIADGGQRENIVLALGNAGAADIAGLFNPVAAVVDLYLHVFDGAFGDEIKAMPLAPATNALSDAIEQVWRWSNMTVERQPLCRLAATHGVTGLRIVAKNDPDPRKRRVYIKSEHPRVIRDIEEDDRGNITAIQLEYEITRGLAEKAEVITIREELTKEEIRTYSVKAGTATPYDLQAMQPNGPMWSYPNELGVVPYVLLRHAHTGDTWSHNAFYHARVPIDRLNALMSHIGIQIHRHVKVKWFIAASGAAPSEIDLTDMTIAYVDQRNATATPIVQPLIANLDLSGAIAQAKMQMDIIEDMLPELKATAGKFLSGQSGETITELRKPAEEKLSLARTNYESAMVSAQKIAVSWGVLLDLWDVGTGKGTREAADRAYQEGYEDHQFNKRPLLTPDPAPVAAVAMQDTPPPPAPTGATVLAPALPMNGNGKMVTN